MSKELDIYDAEELAEELCPYSLTPADLSSYVTPDGGVGLGWFISYRRQRELLGCTIRELPLLEKFIRFRLKLIARDFLKTTNLWEDYYDWSDGPVVVRARDKYGMLPPEGEGEYWPVLKMMWR